MIDMIFYFQGCYCCWSLLLRC